MSARVLVINCGSSSLKYQLIDVEQDVVVAKGLAERIGEELGRVVHDTGDRLERQLVLIDHAAAIAAMIDCFEETGINVHDLAAVGHRVVQGGSRYTESIVIDDDVVAGIEALVPLAPLHNPGHLLGIRAMRRLLPDVPNVAVFDTAFHSTIPPHAYTYAIDRQVAADYGIRRYGFHGTSHRFITHRAAEMLGVPESAVNLIICHIGNGASVTAVQHGQSVDTSMGLTPLEGLVMGTRSGDVDPSILLHLGRVAGYSLADLDALLNRRSGLLGMTGSGDMREVRARATAGDAEARLALDVYGYRLRKYIAAYLGVVTDLHAIVFTAGVGENDPELRAEVMGGLTHLGFALDADANAVRGTDHRIDDGNGHAAVMVIATNEELEIAHESLAVVRG